MKANRVRVSYFDYITITELEIDQKIGEHAKARIRGTIRDKDIEEYKKLLTQKIWVSIIAEDEQGEKKGTDNRSYCGFFFREPSTYIYIGITVKKWHLSYGWQNSFSLFPG